MEKFWIHGDGWFPKGDWNEWRSADAALFWVKRFLLFVRYQPWRT